MLSVRVREYIQRATDFSSGMKLLSNEPGYWNSAGLLAIHSAISYSDALRTGLGDTTLSHRDHSQAADLLEEKLPSWFDKSKGIKQFRKLLSKKSDLEYGRWILSTTDSNDLVTAAIRVEMWANQAGKKLNLEGWTHDDQ